MDDVEVHPRIRALMIGAGAACRTVRHSDMQKSIRTPEDLADALGYDVDRITKTLLVKCMSPDGFCLAVLPVSSRADLAVVADRMRAKRCILAKREELKQCLDYPPMGVSPLASGGIRVLLDQRLRSFETILVGGGAAGVEIEISTTELERMTEGEWLPLS